jgi:hypothetical protein
MSKSSKSNRKHVEQSEEVVVTHDETAALDQIVEQASRRKYDVAKVRAEAASLVLHISGVSNKIRALNAAGWERGKIAIGLGKRYQHVRNVLTKPLKVAG